MKLLADLMFKFLSWNKANTLIFFAEKKGEQKLLIFAAKNINVFENTLATTVNKFVINEPVKLTMLWTTGPLVEFPTLLSRKINFVSSCLLSCTSITSEKGSNLKGKNLLSLQIHQGKKILSFLE